MRKKIENLATVALWLVWFGGSFVALQTLNNDPYHQDRIWAQLARISWTPVIAIAIFLSMMSLLFVFKKLMPTKKEKLQIACQHESHWTTEDFETARKGKILDMYFQNDGLASSVESRTEVVLLPHRETQKIITLGSNDSIDLIKSSALAKNIYKAQSS